MDETDLAILRELFPGGVLRLGGADPRVSAASIASRLDLPRSTVVHRRRVWANEGLFRGWMVFPNPHVLGLRLYGQVLRPSSAMGRDRIAKAIGRLPGVAHLWEVEYGSGFWIGYLARRSTAAYVASRRLAQLEGVRVDQPCHLFPMPTCERTLSSLDWRILRAVRESPDRSLLKIAASLHLGYRSLARRWGALLESRAVLAMPELDFTATRGAVGNLKLSLLPDAELAEIGHRVATLFPVSFPHAPWASPDRVWNLVPNDPDYPPQLWRVVCLKSPTESVKLRRRIEEWPGVTDVEIEFPTRIWGVPGPYDRAIAARLEDRAASESSRG